MESLTANLKGKVRRETLNGVSYLVAPLSMIVPGVLNGSRGAIYYPGEENARYADQWNGMPIVYRHPTNNGVPVSARNPKVLIKSKVGRVYNVTSNRKGVLGGEAWINVEDANRVDRRIVENLSQGVPIEISTGLHIDTVDAPPNSVDHKGRPYQHIARNYRADHLAILLDERGACSLEDGCGLGVIHNNLRWVTINAKKDDDEEKAGSGFASDEQRRAFFAKKEAGELSGGSTSSTSDEGSGKARSSTGKVREVNPIAKDALDAIMKRPHAPDSADKAYQVGGDEYQNRSELRKAFKNWREAAQAIKEAWEARHRTNNAKFVIITNDMKRRKKDDEEDDSGKKGGGGDFATDEQRRAFFGKLRAGDIKETKGFKPVKKDAPTPKREKLELNPDYKPGESKSDDVLDDFNKRMMQGDFAKETPPSPMKSPLVERMKAKGRESQGKVNPLSKEDEEFASYVASPDRAKFKAMTSEKQKRLREYVNKSTPGYGDKPPTGMSEPEWDLHKRGEALQRQWEKEDREATTDRERNAARHRYESALYKARIQVTSQGFKVRNWEVLNVKEGEDFDSDEQRRAFFGKLAAGEVKGTKSSKSKSRLSIPSGQEHYSRSRKKLEVKRPAGGLKDMTVEELQHELKARRDHGEPTFGGEVEAELKKRQERAGYEAAEKRYQESQKAKESPKEEGGGFLDLIMDTPTGDTVKESLGKDAESEAAKLSTEAERLKSQIAEWEGKKYKQNTGKVQVGGEFGTEHTIGSINEKKKARAIRQLRKELSHVNEQIAKAKERANRLTGNSWHTLNTQPSDKADISSEKACKILNDGTAQGHPLTDKQRKMFGAICSERTDNAWQTLNYSPDQPRDNRGRFTRKSIATLPPKRQSLFNKVLGKFGIGKGNPDAVTPPAKVASREEKVNDLKKAVKVQKSATDAIKRHLDSLEVEHNHKRAFGEKITKKGESRLKKLKREYDKAQRKYSRTVEDLTDLGGSMEGGKPSESVHTPLMGRVKKFVFGTNADASGDIVDLLQVLEDEIGRPLTEEEIDRAVKDYIDGIEDDDGFDLNQRWEPLNNENCGIGSEGFERGNTCAKGSGGGGTSSGVDRGIAGRVMDRTVETLKNTFKNAPAAAWKVAKTGAKVLGKGLKFIWDRYGNAESIATFATVGAIAALIAGAPAFAPAAAAAKAAFGASAGVTGVFGGGGLGSVASAGASSLGSALASGSAASIAGAKAALTAGALKGAGFGLAVVEARNVMSGIVGATSTDPEERRAGIGKFTRGFTKNASSDLASDVLKLIRDLGKSTDTDTSGITLEQVKKLLDQYMEGKPTAKSPLTNLFGGSNCGIGKGGFQQGNDCAKGGSGGANPTGANPAGGSIPGHVAKEIDGFFGGVIGGRKGKAQLEDFKGVARGIFSRLTLGTGPLVAKGIAAGIRHSPKAFNLLIKGLQALGPRKTLVDKAQPMGANPASGSRGSTANPMGQAGAGSEGRKKIAEYRTIRNSRWEILQNANCGIAEGGFQKGNKCQKKGSGSPGKTETPREKSAREEDERWSKGEVDQWGKERKKGDESGVKKGVRKIREKLADTFDAVVDDPVALSVVTSLQASGPPWLKKIVSDLFNLSALAWATTPKSKRTTNADAGESVDKAIKVIKKICEIEGKECPEIDRSSLMKEINTNGDTPLPSDRGKARAEMYFAQLAEILKNDPDEMEKLLIACKEAMKVVDQKQAQANGLVRTTDRESVNMPTRNWGIIANLEDTPTDNLLGSVGSTIRKGFGKVAKFLGGTAEGSRKKPYVNPQPDDDDDKPAVPAPPKRVLAPRMKGETFTPAASAARRAARGTSTYEKTKARETATRSKQHLTGLPMAGFAKDIDKIGGGSEEGSLTEPQTLIRRKGFKRPRGTTTGGG